MNWSLSFSHKNCLQSTCKAGSRTIRTILKLEPDPAHLFKRPMTLSSLWLISYFWLISKSVSVLISAGKKNIQASLRPASFLAAQGAGNIKNRQPSVASVFGAVKKKKSERQPVLKIRRETCAQFQAREKYNRCTCEKHVTLVRAGSWKGLKVR